MRPYQRPGESGLLGKLLAVVAGVALLIAGIIFSVMILAAIAVAGLFAWAYFWWKTRGLRKAMREHPAGGCVIDGEAIVVDESKPAQSARIADIQDK